MAAKRGASGGRGPLGTLLLRYRTAAGLTQEELANRAGLSERALGKIERGELRAPRASTLTLLTGALELNTEQTRALRLAAYGTVTVSAAPSSEGSASGALPSPPTPLLGREHEVGALCDLLAGDDAHRLITLVGPGGVGKTRLALEVARAAAHAFADGVCFVPLASVREPRLLPATIAEALGVREAETTSVSMAATICAHLRDRTLLLLIDNCEHLADATPIIAELLAACPLLSVLATSRAPLRLRGEWLFEVEPLALPEDERAAGDREGWAVSLSELARAPAVALFLARARAARPDLELTSAALRATVAICRRLDCLPLAIELAAARCQTLSPQAMLARLEERLPFLVSGPHDLPARQRTLRDTLAWSYELLPPDARILFLRLGAFADGCALNDIEALYDTIDAQADAAPVLDSLSTLIDHHLLRRAPDSVDATPRFAMLETVREYAVTLLNASEETLGVRRAHAEHYLALAEATQPQLRGPDSEDALRRLREQVENFRLALAWLESSGEVVASLRLAGALWRFWYMLGTLSEGRSWLERVLSQDGAPDIKDATDGADAVDAVDAGSDIAATYGAARALALHGMAVLCAVQGDYAQATVAYEATLTLRRALGDQRGTAATLTNLGSLTLQRGVYPRAEALLTEALALKRALDDQRGIASSLGALASVALQRGDYDRAEQLNREAVETCQRIGDPHELASALNDLANVAYRKGACASARALGEQGLLLLRDGSFPVVEAFLLATLGSVAWAQGEYDRATTLLERCLAVRVDVGQVWGAAEARMLLGRVECFRGLYQAAETHCHDAFTIFSRLGAPRDMAECLEALAAIAAGQGQAERGAWLWGAAEAVRTSIGAPLPPVERTIYTPVLTQIRVVLGSARYATLLVEGGTLSPKQAWTMTQGV